VSQNRDSISFTFREVGNCNVLSGDIAVPGRCQPNNDESSADSHDLDQISWNSLFTVHVGRTAEMAGYVKEETVKSEVH